MRLVHLLDQYGYNIEVNPEAIAHVKAYTTSIQITFIGEKYPIYISGYGDVLNALDGGSHPDDTDRDHVCETHEKPEDARARQDAARKAALAAVVYDPPPPHRFGFGR